VTLVIVLLRGWEGRAQSIFLTAIIMGVVSIMILYKKGYIVFEISKDYIKNVLTFSIPIIPHALSFWIKSGADKIMLTDMCGLEENGLYSVAVTWGAIVSMLMVAFSNSYSPWLFKKLSFFDKNKDGTISNQQRLVRMIWLTLIGIFFIVFVIYWVSAFLIDIMYPENYSGSQRYLPFVMLSEAFNGAYLLFVCFLHYTFKTKILGATTFTLSIVQITLAYLFISYFGAIGVAYSSVIGSMLTFSLIALFGIHAYKLPWFNYKNINDVRKI
jgi:O-antigen/teichoic acid export membrane protein